VPAFGAGPFGLGVFGVGVGLLEPGVPAPSWTLRGRNTARADGDVFDAWSSLTLVENFTEPDRLQVTGRTVDLAGLWVPGAGCTLWSDVLRFSGVCFARSYNGAGESVVTFVGDTVEVWDEDVYPDPASVFEAQTTAYYPLSGTVETVLLNLINVNIGPGALVARRVPGLTIPASLGRGGTITGQARLDNLGRLVADICDAAGLRVRVVPNGAGLAVVVDDAPDLSATIGYGTPESGGPGLLGSDWEVSERRPEMTVADAAGAGEGLARLLTSRTSAEAAVWGRISGIVDQTSISVLAELQAAADKELATKGATREVRTSTLVDDPEYPISAVPMGAVIRLDLPGQPPILERLRARTTTIGGDGQTVQVTGSIGSANADRTETDKQLFEVKRALRKVQTR